MRATEIIRDFLDLIDKIDGNEAAPEVAVVSAEPDAADVYGDTMRRFKQIAGLVTQPEDCNGQYANSPNEVVTGVDSVTIHAGGGMNGPKHPSDIRTAQPSMYPMLGAKE